VCTLASSCSSSAAAAAAAAAAVRRSGRGGSSATAAAAASHGFHARTAAAAAAVSRSGRGGASSASAATAASARRGFRGQAAEGWSSAYSAKLNMHPMMVTPKVFRVPFLGISIKMSAMEAFGHLSFVLLGAAYMTRDVVTLRCIAVGGLSAAVVFQFFRPVPLWLPLRWNLVFVGINAAWVGVLWWEEHLVGLYKYFT
jgi:hypothetical protein